MEVVVENGYKDPFWLTVFGILFIVVGLAFLLHHMNNRDVYGFENDILDFLLWKLDHVLMIILGITFILIAFGILETLATLVMILIILKKVVFWFI